MDETVLKDVEFGEAAKENVRQAVRSHSHEPWRRRNFFWFKYGLGVAVCFLLLFGGIFYALSQQTPWGVGKQAEWESGAHGGGSSNSNRSDSYALEKEDDKEDSSGQGKTIRTGQPSSDTRLKIIRMFGREKGWKLTNQDVLRTVNGGKKWSKAGPDYSDLQVNKAFFL
ncbi:MAG TPA: hypothetical protein VF199_03660, partial [Bacillales bacterium]